MKCKTCGCNAESEYCFRHKPRKPLNNTKSTLTSRKREVDVESINEMHEFFLSIWSIKPHYCENCNKYLGKEPLSYMFDHLLEKSKYPDLKFEEENIMIVCLECHDNKTRGNLSPFINNKLKIIREKFGK